MAIDPPKHDHRTLQRFTELWLENQHLAAGFIRLQVRDHHKAEDIIQEVARDATANFDRYDPSRPFAAWLIGISRMRMAEHFRKHGRQPMTFSTDIVDSVADAFIEIQPQVDDRMAALRVCIDRLGDRQRQLLKLRYDQMLSPERIGEKIGKKPNTINVMLHRVRKALAECVRLRMESRP